MTRALPLILAILWPAPAPVEPSGVTGWRLWQTLTERHGRPLRIELR